MLVNVECVIGPEATFVNGILVVSLAFIETGILLCSWVDFHLGFNLILSYFEFMNLFQNGIKNLDGRL